LHDDPSGRHIHRSPPPTADLDGFMEATASAVRRRLRGGRRRRRGGGGQGAIAPHL